MKQGTLIPETRRRFRTLRTLAQVTESMLGVARTCPDREVAASASLLAAECALQAERIARFTLNRPHLDAFAAHLSGVWGPGAVCPESPTASLRQIGNPSPLSNTGLLAQNDPGALSGPEPSLCLFKDLGAGVGGVATGSIFGGGE